MKNNRNPALLLIVVALLVIVGYFMLQSAHTKTLPASGTTESVQAFVTQNIATLSPVKAVVGGTFYVTRIDAAAGSGTVNYEDGHNAYVADFTYDLNDQGGLKITSFIIRQ